MDTESQCALTESQEEETPRSKHKLDNTATQSNLSASEDHDTDKISSLDNLILKLHDEYESNDSGPPVSDHLARLTQKLLKLSLSEDTVRTKVDSCKWPLNVELLVTPKVNKEVWSFKSVKVATRTQGLKFKKNPNTFGQRYYSYLWSYR